MKQIIILIFAISNLALIWLLSSCSPVLYAPSAQNVPLLKEKGEVNIGGGFTYTESTVGINLNFAVAVDSNWAVAGSLSRFFNAGDDGEDYNDYWWDTNSDWDSKGGYYEGSVGWFGSSPQGPWVYESFLGLGYASVKNEQQGNMVNAQFLKPYLQPSFGFRSKIVDVAVTPRLAVVHYIDEQIRISNSEDIILFNEFFDSKGTSFVFEPGVTLRLGGKNFKFQLQHVYSTFSYNSRNSSPADKNVFSLGLNFYPK